MPYVLQIHIGPVQSFIAAARRSRDLWFGSWLLSELSKAAAKSIAENKGEGINALVFPAPASLEDLAANSALNVANKIVAVVNGRWPRSCRSRPALSIRTRRSSWPNVAMSGPCRMRCGWTTGFCGSGLRGILSGRRIRRSFKASGGFRGFRKSLRT